MNDSLVDFSFIYDMSDNDSVYVNEVATLFLKTVSDGLAKLEDLINNSDDFEQIRRQAHFLKSSANVIKIKGMFDDFIGIEMIAREGSEKGKMLPILENLLITFKEALPVLEAEIAKTKPK